MNRFFETVSLYSDLLFYFALCVLMIAIAVVLLLSAFVH